MSMQKKKKYQRVKFTPEVLRSSLERFGPPENVKLHSIDVSGADDTTWEYDNPEEGFAAYRDRDVEWGYVSYGEKEGDGRLICSFNAISGSTVTVKKSTRSEVERVFEVFEASIEACRLPEPSDEKLKRRLTIFIGHGRSTAFT
jgi:hypothetical protein